MPLAHGAVDLHQIGARVQALQRRAHGADAAHADQAQRRPMGLAQAAQQPEVFVRRHALGRQQQAIDAGRGQAAQLVQHVRAAQPRRGELDHQGQSRRAAAHERVAMPRHRRDDGNELGQRGPARTGVQRHVVGQAGEGRDPVRQLGGRVAPGSLRTLGEAHAVAQPRRRARLAHRPRAQPPQRTASAMEGACRSTHAADLDRSQARALQAADQRAIGIDARRDRQGAGKDLPQRAHRAAARRRGLQAATREIAARAACVPGLVRDHEGSSARANSRRQAQSSSIAASLVPA